MVEESSETTYTVTILRVKNEAARAVVTRTLSGVTKNAPLEQIQVKMQKLPWTISRRASEQKARRLVQLLGKLGAVLEIQPPLPGIVVPQDVSQTQIMSRDELASQPGLHVPAGPDSTSGARDGAEPPLELIPQPSRPVLTLEPVKPALEEETPDRDDAELELEPLTLGGILDRSFQICRRHFWKLLTIVAIPWLLTALVGPVALVAVLFPALTKQYLQGIPFWMWIVLGVTVLPAILIVWMLAFFVAQGALVHAVSNIHVGRPVMIRQAYRFVLGRLGKYVGTSALMIPIMLGLTVLLGIAGGLVALVGYGFFLLFKELTSSGWWSAFTWPLLTWILLGCTLVYTYVLTKLFLADKVVIIENLGYTKALRRSWNLLTVASKDTPPLDYVIRFVLLLQIFLLLNLAISFLFQVPALLFALFVSEPKFISTIVKHVMNNLGGIIAGLYGTVAAVLFYYDLRNRKEGFDLKMPASVTDGREGND